MSARSANGSSDEFVRGFTTLIQSRNPWFFCYFTRHGSLKRVVLYRSFGVPTNSIARLHPKQERQHTGHHQRKKSVVPKTARFGKRNHRAKYSPGAKRREDGVLIARIQNPYCRYQRL
jgi:hypothetical protein